VSADKAIQAIKAMEKQKDEELRLGLGTLSVAGNKEVKNQVPRKDVSQ
jgi:hypothetical protein